MAGGAVKDNHTVNALISCGKLGCNLPAKTMPEQIQTRDILRFQILNSGVTVIKIFLSDAGFNVKFGRIPERSLVYPQRINAFLSKPLRNIFKRL